MAEAIYLVTKTLTGGETLVGKVRAVVINKDDGQTDPQIIADAVAQMNTLYSADPVPTGYFDTVTKISDLSSGPLKDNKDCYVFTPEGPVKVEG